MLGRVWCNTARAPLFAQKIASYAIENAPM